MRYPPRFLDELRDRTRLGDLVGRRVKLVRAGRELKGLCPFHTEKTPSFHVVEDKGFYHCFGCGGHGDAFDFLEQTEGLSFTEAVAELATRAGMELPRPDPEARRRAEERAGLADVMEAATQFYQAQLGKAAGAEARRYLAERGLAPQTIPDFRLGFAPEERGALRAALERRGIDRELMIEAGLLKAPEDGGEPYEYFRNRILFPITDRRGRVIAFGGRAMAPDNPAKYLNSPDTPLFHKGHTLYNLARARKAALDAGTVVVVEGYMDVIALAEAGLAHAVAPLGTALTEAQIEELWRLAPEPVLCFDGDAAGLAAAARAARRALPILRPGQSLRFALMPEGMDPDDLVRREGAQAMRKLLDAAIPLADTLWQSLTRDLDTSTPERRAGTEKRVMGVLAEIADEKVRSFYRRDFRDRLYTAFAPWARRGRGPSERTRAGGASRLMTTRLARSEAEEDTGICEQLVLYYLLNHPALGEAHLEELAELVFGDRALDKLRHELLVTLSSAQDLDREALRAHLGRHGFGEMVARLDTSALVQQVRAARADATLEEAETGWRHVMARLRRVALKRDVAAAKADYERDQSEDAWRRLIELKRELDRAEGTEAETYGVLFRSS